MRCESWRHELRLGQITAKNIQISVLTANQTPQPIPIGLAGLPVAFLPDIAVTVIPKTSGPSVVEASITPRLSLLIEPITVPINPRIPSPRKISPTIRTQPGNPACVCVPA